MHVRHARLSHGATRQVCEHAFSETCLRYTVPTSLQLLLQTHASRAAPPLAHLVASTTTLRDNSFNSLDERPTVRCARRGTSFRRTFGGGWAAQPPPPAAQPAGVFAFLFGLRGPPRNSPFPFGAINRSVGAPPLCSWLPPLLLLLLLLLLLQRG